MCLEEVKREKRERGRVWGLEVRHMKEALLMTGTAPEQQNRCPPSSPGESSWQQLDPTLKYNSEQKFKEGH